MVKKSKFMRAINWILNILIVIFLIVVIYVIFVRVFGSSPTDFQVLSSILGLYGMAILKLFTLIYGLNKEIGELKIGVKRGFKRIKKDIGGINDRLDKFGEDIQEIKFSLKKGRGKEKIK